MRQFLYLILWLFCSLAKAEEWNLVFNDEFDEFDSKFWTKEEEERHHAFNVGNQVRVEDGKLIISAQTIDEKHYTGIVSSKNKVNFGYGYMEISAKINPVSGTWIDWWLLNDSMFTNKVDKLGHPNIPQELDIFEIRATDASGKNISNGIFRCIHWNYYFDLEKNCEGVFTDNLNINNNKFHTFGFLRTKKEYIFYVNGKETSRSKKVTNLDFYMLFSVEIRDNFWAGNIPMEGYNQDCLTIDYIRYYRPPAPKL